MPLDYSLYPIRFKHVLKLLDREDIEFSSKFFRGDISLESDIRQLCYWLESNHIAEPIWFDVLIKLVRKLKIPILLNFNKAFYKIHLEQKLVKKFEKNGKKLMS